MVSKARDVTDLLRAAAHDVAHGDHGALRRPAASRSPASMTPRVSCESRRCSGTRPRAPGTMPTRREGDRRRPGSARGDRRLLVRRRPRAPRTARCGPRARRASWPVGEDPEDPRLQRRATLEAVDPAQHADPRLLHDLLGDRLAADEHPREPQHRRPVQLDEPHERSLVARAQSAATSCDSSSACTRANVTPAAPAGLPAKAEGSRRETKDADLRADERRGEERDHRVRARRDRRARVARTVRDRRAGEREAPPGLAELGRRPATAATAGRERRQRRGHAVRRSTPDGLELVATARVGRQRADEHRGARRARLRAQQRRRAEHQRVPLADGGLEPIEGSTRPLERRDADPAQIAFSPDGRTLVVTERGTNAISAFTVDERRATPSEPDDDRVRRARRPTASTSQDDAVIVTEAFGGEVGKAAASSYALDGAGAARSRSAPRSRTRAARSAGRRRRRTAASST